jgi:hypothetical protein
MTKSTRARLERAGWRVGSVQEFLGLSEAELALIEFKAALARMLRETRVASGMTQTEAARRLASSQSRVAKMEAADPGVTVDLLVRAVLALGAQAGDIARALAAQRSGRGRGR